jgi:hypothetical protein
VTRRHRTLAVSAIALLALLVRGYVARVEVASVTAVPLPHQDHRPRHGGLVLMNGDTHFEVLFDASGRSSVYFSDAIRTPMDPATASQVSVAVMQTGYVPAPVDLQIDAANARWVGHDAPIDDPNAVVRITYTMGQKPYWIDVPVSAWTLNR